MRNHRGIGWPETGWLSRLAQDTPKTAVIQINARFNRAMLSFFGEFTT